MALTAVVRGFGGLFLTRLGVGAGEASLTPAAHSIIRDVAHPDVLARAMAVFGTGSVLGLGAAYLMGGQLFAVFSEFGSQNLWGWTIAPWQMVFVAFAVPGLVLVGLLSMVREPQRRTHDLASNTSNDVARKQAIRANPMALAGLYVGIGFYSTAIHAFNAWLPSHFVRAFGWSIADVGLVFSGIIIVGGLIGMFASGFAGDRLGTGEIRAKILMRITGFSALVAIPILGGAALWSSAWATILILVPAVALTAVPAVLGPSVVQMVAPVSLRARYSALYLMSYTLVGVALGPALVGLVSDSGLNLAYAISLVATVSLSAAAFAFLSSSAAFRQPA